MAKELILPVMHRNTDQDEKLTLQVEMQKICLNVEILFKCIVKNQTPKLKINMCSTTVDPRRPHPAPYNLGLCQLPGKGTLKRG